MPRVSSTLWRSPLVLTGWRFVLSEILLQGMRFALLLYLGWISVDLAGAFLFGGAIGFLAATVSDFGTNQHVLRAPAGGPLLQRPVVRRLLTWKVWLGLGGGFVVGALLFLNDHSGPATLAVMIGGLVLANLQILAEGCESVCLTLGRPDVATRFRVLLGSVIYGTPMLLGPLTLPHAMVLPVSLAVPLAALLGIGLLALYARAALALLPAPQRAAETDGAKPPSPWSVWSEARWLGINQIAMQIEVRAPLLILGLMLGQHAVGLYGLVQRTVAVVEVVLAPVTKLMLPWLSDARRADDMEGVYQRGVRASWLISSATLVFVGCLIGGSLLVEAAHGWPSDVLTSLEILRWAAVALFLSTMKRPLAAALIVLHREQAVSVGTLLSAGIGLLLNPPLILAIGVVGSALSWIAVELCAIAWLFWQLRSVRPPKSNRTDDGNMSFKPASARLR